MIPEKLFLNYKREIRKRLAAACPRDKTQLSRAIRYTAKRPGKFLRSLLLVASGKGCGAPSGSLYRIATAIELLHNFTLVHDDIMDKPKIRRGAKPVYAAWDSNLALLTGDALFALSLREITAIRNSEKLTRVFVENLYPICHGQALDLESSGKENLSLSAYFEMTDLKTGRLFALSSRMGAIAGGEGREIENIFAKIGLLIGRAYQIRDDYEEIFPAHELNAETSDRDIILRRKSFLILQGLKYKKNEFKSSLSAVAANYDKGMRAMRKQLQNWGICDLARSEMSKIYNNIQQHLKALGGKGRYTRAYLDWIWSSKIHIP